MLVDEAQRSPSAEASTDAASGGARVAELEKTIMKLQEDQASGAEEARTKEKETEQSLREAQQVGTMIELGSAVGSGCLGFALC